MDNYVNNYLSIIRIIITLNRNYFTNILKFKNTSQVGTKFSDNFQKDLPN